MYNSQKLIAYDHLEGDPGLEGGKNVPLFTDILNMICGCIDNSSPDRYVPLHIMNTFHTFVLLFYDQLFAWDDMQYNFASVEGSSYGSCICEVQRYMVIDRWLWLFVA